MLTSTIDEDGFMAVMDQANHKTVMNISSQPSVPLKALLASLDELGIQFADLDDPETILRETSYQEHSNIHKKDILSFFEQIRYNSFLL